MSSRDKRWPRARENERGWAGGVTMPSDPGQVFPLLPFLVCGEGVESRAGRNSPIFFEKRKANIYVGLLWLNYHNT